MKKMNGRRIWKFVLRAGNLLVLVLLAAGAYGRFTGRLAGVWLRPVEPPAQEQPPQETEVRALPERTSLSEISWPSYMIYYGALDDALIEQAKQYDVVILHPRGGDMTREQVREIQSGGAYVLGYLSIGEDLRTEGMTPEQMLQDERFTGDKTGPRIDGREPGSASLEGASLLGEASPAGGGYASYYLDDNDRDGKPDFNPNFGCAYTNIGDPAWYAALEYMTLDGPDGIPGIREILTEDYGRGLGCDGLFLDTIDTCAPNMYTEDSDPSRTRFEWTAPGVLSFLKQLKADYPDKYVLQNRGLFFFHYQLPHFDYTTGEYIDFLMYESFMLDSNSTTLYYETYFTDNKNVYGPKISAEANRPNGFRVLSLGYAEGPGEYRLKESLIGESETGLDILLEDMNQAQEEAGFTHYITDGALLLANNFVLEHREAEDTRPPLWSSVHNNSIFEEPKPHAGIGEAEPASGGMVVRWDVAVDKSGVDYTLYYQQEPFDFEADPDLENAQKLELTPERGDGYGYDAQDSSWPYQEEVSGLQAGETYYFVIRAKDRSPAGNEEKNTVVATGVPLA